MSNIELGTQTPAQPGISVSEAPMPPVTAYLPPEKSPKELAPIPPEQQTQFAQAVDYIKFMKQVDVEAKKIETQSSSTPPTQKVEPSEFPLEKPPLRKVEEATLAAAGIIAGTGPGVVSAVDVAHELQNPPPAIVQAFGSHDARPSMLPPTSREPIVSPPTPAPGMPGMDRPTKGGPIAADTSPTAIPIGNTKDLTPEQEHKDMLNVKNTPEPPKSPEKETKNNIVPDQIALTFPDIQTEADLEKFKQKNGPVYKEITENPDYQNLLGRVRTFISEYTTGKGLNAKDFNFSITYKFADGKVHIGTIIYQLNNQQFAEAFYFLPQVDQPGPVLKVGLPAEKVGYWTITLAYDTSLKKQVAALTDAEGTFLSVIDLPPEGVTSTPTPTPPQPDQPTIEVATYIVTPEAQLQKQGTEKIVVEKVNPPSTDIQKTIDAQNKEVEKQPAILKKMRFYSSFLGRDFFGSKTQNIQNTSGELPLKFYGAYLDRVRYAMWITYVHADQPAPLGWSPDDFQNNAYRGKNGFSPDGNSQSPVMTFEEFKKEAQEGKSFEIWVPDYTNGTRNFEDGREIKWKKIDLSKVDIDIKMDKTWKKGTKPVSTDPSSAPYFYMTEMESQDGKQTVQIIYNPGSGGYVGKNAEILAGIEEVTNRLLSPSLLIRPGGVGTDDPVKGTVDIDFVNKLIMDAVNEIGSEHTKEIATMLQYTTKPVSTTAEGPSDILANLNTPNLSDARAMFLSNKPSRKDLKNL